MPLETLRIDVTNGVGRIALDRPDKRNAMDTRMARELEETLRELEGRPDVRVVSIRGAGGHFCSGGDLAPDRSAEPPSGSPASITLDIMNRVYAPAILAVHRFPKPVVAFVEGVAAGAGANLALACDLVYATPETRFCEIFVRRGLSLDCGGSWLLPRLVGLQKAKEIAFFGDWIGAAEAASMGLVSAVFESDGAETAVEARLARLAAKAPIALGLIKQSLNRSMSLTLAESLEAEAVAQATCTATEDCAEGMRAFLEKREPLFRGR